MVQESDSEEDEGSNKQQKEADLFGGDRDDDDVKFDVPQDSAPE